MKLLPLIPWVIGRVVHGGESSIRQVGWTRTRSLRRLDITLTAGLVMPLLLWSAGVGLAQTVDTTLWATNGRVYSIVSDGSTTYIGGDFSAVGPVTGSGVAIDASTGAAQQPYSKVAGIVYAVAADGSGGWYLGGAFTAVRGQPRNNLAHLDAGGNLTAWDPNANGSVIALAVSGGTVYIGGLFTSIGGQPRNNIAALDAGTGAATAWDPNANNYVLALAVSGGTVYAGGDFTSIGGAAPRNRIAALDAATGAATAWNPSANERVRALAVSGGTVYAGGYFTAIGGQVRNYIAALDAATGAATAFNPNAFGFPGSFVHALAVSGGTVYAGGNFWYIGGQPRVSIAALDAATGAATAWNASTNQCGDYRVCAVFVSALAVSGGTVYAGGNFSSIGGQSHRYIAAIDSATGAATSWHPNPSSAVAALAVSGDRVYAGGHFTSIGAQRRICIAAIDVATGAATAWNPNPVNETYCPPGSGRPCGVAVSVRALALSGGTVYAGGRFTSIGGQPRNRIAALDAATGVATAWDPNANPQDYLVSALTVSGGTVYAGGDFTSIGGQPRNYIAALDAATGAATAWNPNANSYVRTLAVSGGTVYAGGSFTSIGGQPRNYIAALDAANGAATAWNPNAISDPYNYGVAALAVSGGTVYAGGAFNSIGGQARNNIAAIDAATGAATAWDPNASNSVAALAVSGGTVYAGGSFTSIGGQPRNYIAALDAANGAVTAWNPNANGSVNALAVSGGTVYAGGGFGSIGGQLQSGIAAISTEVEVCPSVAMSFDFNPNTLNLQSMGPWVTGTLEPEPPALPSDIDIASIRLNGDVPVDASAPTSIGDADSDGRPDLTVKFNRAAVELAVTEGDSVPVTVTGTIGQGCFSATDVIRVIRGHVTAPAAGAVLQGGSAAEVRWDTPAGIEVQSVAVLWTSDDGATWSLVAHELPNTGSYSWSVPSTGTGEARVAVVLVESADASGYDVTGVLAVSGRFVITTPLSVTVPRVDLALDGSVPNPATSLTVSFSLPDAQPASLVAYDVSGRELGRRAVGTLGAGRHVVTLGTSRTLAPGVYLVHLIRGDRRLIARTVVVR